MRKLYFLIPIIGMAIVLIQYVVFEEAGPKIKTSSKSDSIQGAIENMLFTSRDIDLGYIPYEKLFAAIEEGEKRIEQVSNNRSSVSSLADAKWIERGPNNIGGRTRTVMIDESDPSRNRIWTGSVSGGVWRTEDITKDDPQWVQLAPELDNLAIGCIAQDPNNHQVVYVGTGEAFPNIDAVTGAGIFKTMDDGLTWTWLSSTQNDNFKNVHEVYVHTNGDIYSGTQTGGLFRSTDGGNVWQKVLGTGLSGANNNNFFDFLFIESNQTFYASNANSLFKSSTGNRGDWLDIGKSKPGFPDDLIRVELAICPTNPDIIYVLGSIDNKASNTYMSENGGENWVVNPRPGEDPEKDFTNGQAWYDLEIGVDPQLCYRILAGGVHMFESESQGLVWKRFRNVVDDTEFHPDHHLIKFDLKKRGRSYFTNDGGIWMSENFGHDLINKNFGYVTTQFYAAAIHPGKGSTYILGGTQDNRTLQITEKGLSPAKIVWQGDGMYCFIDQNEPDIQIVSSQYGRYGITRDGGKNFEPGVDVEGSFINRSGYDDNAKILYGQVSGADFFRWDINTLKADSVDIRNMAIGVTAVRPDPVIPNRIYFGGGGGQVMRVDNAHVGDTVQGTLLANFPSGAAVSCIYMDKLDTNHLLVSLFNFGSSLDNIFISYDGGADWISIEGDLPDMPVRWALFDPRNHDRVMIATEAGVWVTDDVDGGSTHWVPVSPQNGMPFVKVDMLVIRESDYVVLAGTHGRGLFTTDVFADPTPVIRTQDIAYQGQPLILDGSQSLHAQKYNWNLGDNYVSDSIIITHTYDQPGTYTVTLTINDSLTETKNISVLPYLQSPYQHGGLNYTGDFETRQEHFAPLTIKGTGFDRGASLVPGKDGTNSGSFAWVLGKDDNYYQNKTHAHLYTPKFDLVEQGLYTLKYWAQYSIQNQYDGFQIEYSSDGGVSWIQLGDEETPDWYNFKNTNFKYAAFPVGHAYFTNVEPDWMQFNKDISFLAGSPEVSFRFVFRSDASFISPGVAIDDFEITRYEGALETELASFDAAYTSFHEVDLSWSTSIEYQCQYFLLERSYTGFEFSEVAQIQAKGFNSSTLNEYSLTDPITQTNSGIVYYRLKVINENQETGYVYHFYSDTLVVDDQAEPDKVNTVLPNPFEDKIGISFTNAIHQTVNIKLFNTAGLLIRDETTTPNAISYQLDQLQLAAGIYILVVQIGDQNSRAYKLFTEG